MSLALTQNIIHCGIVALLCKYALDFELMVSMNSSALFNMTAISKNDKGKTL